MKNKKSKPPVILKWFIKHSASASKRSIVGDMKEEFFEITDKKGHLSGWFWYTRQVFVLLVMMVFNSIFWEITLFKNYLKTAVRNIKKQKLYSFVNLAGLSIGMACCLIFYLYINHELSYDRFFKNADRIYRIKNVYSHGDRITHTVITPNPLGDYIKERLPEIESAVRIGSGGGRKILLSYDDKSFYEDNFLLTDGTFFEVFSFQLVSGDPKSALSMPFSMVISEQAADKYFGDEDPLGKTITYENKHDFKITGIIENLPENCHFQSDFFASMSSADKIYWDGFLEDWTQWSLHTYLLLKEDCNIKELERKLTLMTNNQRILLSEESIFKNIRHYLQPVTSIHLHSNLVGEFEKNSDIRYIYFYSLIAVIILMTACINFMNLSTAKSTTRFAEVGMRKVIGAHRIQLIRQFLTESVIFSFICLPAVLILVQLLLPFFKDLTEINISLNNIDLSAIFTFFSIAFIVGVVSGIYPAFFMSAFNPVRMLKGSIFKSPKKMHVRNFLVTLQFVISIGLIICTLVIYSQVSFIKNKDLGFNKDNVLAVHISYDDKDFKKKYEFVKSELLKNTNILGVTATSNLPHRNYAAKMLPAGDPGDGRFYYINFMRVDYDFVKTLNAEIVNGRNFSEKISSDYSAFLINESAVKEFGFGNPIGKQVSWYGDTKRKVIGVISDFHFKSLHEKIEPIVLYLQKGGNIDHILIRINKEKTIEAVGFIKNTLKKFNPSRPVEYFFLDEDIDKIYKSETKFLSIFKYFSVLAVFIASLGLFGLASFSIRQRTKEVSIRKVLGASLSNIIIILSKDLLKLILAANIFAWPVSFYLMKRWLQQFAYKTDVSILIYIFAAFFTLFISLVILVFFALRTGIKNPVENLKYE